MKKTIFVARWTKTWPHLISNSELHTSRMRPARCSAEWRCSRVHSLQRRRSHLPGAAPACSSRLSTSSVGLRKGSVSPTDAAHSILSMMGSAPAKDAMMRPEWDARHGSFQHWSVNKQNITNAIRALFSVFVPYFPKLRSSIKTILSAQHALWSLP